MQREDKKLIIINKETKGRKSQTKDKKHCMYHTQKKRKNDGRRWESWGQGGIGIRRLSELILLYCFFFFFF